MVCFIDTMPQTFILHLQLYPNIKSMFPNDDICNVDVAKSAAQRLFRKYRERGGKQESGLGKNQVNRLMKATYEAINMPYDPNQEDVFSFMGVFDSNNDGKIELKDLEQMAVKYLCGTDALKQLGLPKSKSPIKKEVKLQTKKIEKISISGQSTLKIQNQQKPINKIELTNKKQLRIEINEPEDIQPYQQRVYTPSIAYKPTLINSYYSPKNRISFKDNISSTNTEATSLKSQFNTPKQKLSQPEVLKRGKDIFNNHSLGSKKGLVQQSAGKVLSQTYELFGKKNYNPSSEDVKIWMKLCDKNKDSIVEWQDYEYFLLRTYERENSQK